MRISPISAVNPLGSLGGIEQIGKSSQSEQSAGTGSVSFGGAMKKALGEVNNVQQNADKMAVQLATGDVEDVHKAMIAMNKAKLAFDMTLQVRNKVLEAYQEVMRMQV